jgi:hypothetical protein
LSRPDFQHPHTLRFQGAECDVIILTTAVTRPGPFAAGTDHGMEIMCRLTPMTPAIPAFSVRTELLRNVLLPQLLTCQLASVLRSCHADSCRLNVALTRARHNLLIVGCVPALQKAAPAFAALLVRCRRTPGGYHAGRLPAGAGPALLAQPAAAPPPDQVAEVLGEEVPDDEEGWAALGSVQ